jgi:hypothetical protein
VHAGQIATFLALRKRETSPRGANSSRTGTAGLFRDRRDGPRSRIGRRLLQRRDKSEEKCFIIDAVILLHQLKKEKLRLKDELAGHYH